MASAQLLYHDLSPHALLSSPTFSPVQALPFPHLDKASRTPLPFTFDGPLAICCHRRFDAEDSVALHRDRPTSDEAANDQPENELDCCNVLVVDDQPTNLALIEASLSGLAIRIVTASSGIDALEKARHLDFMLILMDIRMPGMSGIDATIEMRKLPRHAQTPVIFVTAYTPEDQEMLGGYQAGAIDYLFKPIMPQILRSKVAAFAELYRSNREAKRQAALEATRRQLEEDKAQLEKLAHYDALTGLANRKHLLDCLKLSLGSAVQEHRSLALLFVDLDEFKQINDSHGHDAGDAVLCVVAARLRHCVRKDDIVARLGGDEFVILLQGIDSRDCAIAVAEKAINNLGYPIHVNGVDLCVTASMGMSVFPDDGNDVESLLKNADLALYRAKEIGKNNCQLYSEELGRHARMRMRTEDALRQAIGNGEFVLYYQPKLDLGERRVDSVEALLRWNQGKELLTSKDFIDVAEESGLLVPIGEWVVKTACEQICQWDRQGLPPIRVAINLSLRQITDENLCATVERTLRECNIPASRLEFEITESVVMRNAAHITDTLNCLHALGVRLSMDNFGIGLCSLRYLQDLPLDTLKLDQKFVHELTASERGLGLARNIIAMAKSLGMDTIAEGVETSAQLKNLQAEGCDRIQGYIVSKPLPAGDMQTLMQTQCTLVERLLTV